MIHFFSTYQLNKKLKARKLIRKARQEAAKQGVSNEWKKRGQRCREMFG